MKKKYLLHDNAEVAQQRIASIKENMVDPLNNFISTIKGVSDISFEDIKKILKNGNQVIESIIPPVDIDGVSSQLVPILEKERQDTIGTIWREYSKFKNNTADGMPINSSKAISMLEMDESGFIRISEKAIKNIEEECKEYIITPIGCELYEIQHELADLMQKFHDKLEEATNIPGKTMTMGAKAVLYTLFPLSAFHFKRIDDDKIIVTPKAINFDPINLED